MAQLSALIRRYKADTLSAYRLSCATLSAKNASRVPVDQGSLRASWTPNNGEPIARNVDIGEDPSAARVNDVAKVVNTLQLGDTYSLANGQPYARRIEYEGHSAQAPSGTMRVTAAEWDQIVNQAVRDGS